MLLAIDAGNTNIVFALFQGSKIVAVWRSATHAQTTADEYAVFLRTLMAEASLDPLNITDAIMGSVVPEANFHLTKLCRDHFHCDVLVVGQPDLDIGIKILLDRPEEIGADRIINAVGGLRSYKPPLLIIDFGTATTFDVINAEGHYMGGAIAPGINLSLQALHMAAAKLPRVGIAPSKHVIGKNTHDAIQSGIFWGYTSLIEGMIKRITHEFSQPMIVVATGGLARLFANSVQGIHHYDNDLTLQGLHTIFERQKHSKKHKAI